jgi:hypothetical protein
MIQWLVLFYENGNNVLSIDQTQSCQYNCAKINIVKLTLCDIEIRKSWSLQEELL